MNYVSLITSLLMLVQAVLVIIVAKREESSTEKQETQINEETEENSHYVQVKKYKRFDMITSIFTLLIMVGMYIYYIWNPSRLMPRFDGRAAVTVSLIMLLYLVYVNTNSYKDIKYIFNTFSDGNKVLSVYELAISSQIFGLIVVTINNHFINMNLAKGKESFAQMVEIISKVTTIATLIVMSASIIITIAYYIKERNLDRKWKRLHKMIAKQVYGNIPSRRYLERKRTWISGFLKQASFFIMDCLYKIPMFLLILLNKILSAVCELLYGIIRTTGKICGIVIIDKYNIGKARSMLNVLWGGIIIALSFTYFSIVLSNKYPPSLEKVYSFITGIIVIPTILTVANKKKLGVKNVTEKD